jgi:hypothetical protein
VKVIEKVVAQLLSDETDRRSLLSNGQFDSRKKLTVIDTAAIMLDSTQSALNQDNITGVLLMHINTAFPRVARLRLFDAVKGNQLDGDLIKWTESFLSDRTLEIGFKGYVLQCDSVEAVVQQGSSVSPILFAIHTARIIRWVE